MKGKKLSEKQGRVRLRWKRENFKKIEESSAETSKHQQWFKLP